MTIDPKDDELMLRIQRKNVDPKLADEAFVSLFERHKQDLYKSIENANQKLVGFGVDSADIVEKTFSKVWFGAAETFNPKNYDKPDGPFIHVQCWLQAIAKNLITDCLRSPKRMVPLDPTGENANLFDSLLAEVDTEADEDGNDPYEWLHQLVAATLKDRDQAIIWFKIRFYDRATGLSEPPDAEMSAFCQKWDIKPPALRQAYVRALKKLAKAASNSTQLQPSSTEPGDSNAYAE